MKNKELYSVDKVTDIKDLLKRSCTLYSDNCAFLTKDQDNKYKEISYKKLYNDTQSLGTAFMSMGLHNCKIAVIGENRYEWALTYLSVVTGVGVIVPLDKELPAEEIENLLNRSDAKAVVFSKKLRTQFAEIKAGLKRVNYFIDMDLDWDSDNYLSLNRLIEKGQKQLSKGETSFIDAEINSERMCSLIYTSGTTDLAKGVMLSHKNICSNVISVLATVKVTDKDRTLSILPMHHVYECTIGFFGLIFSGGTIAFNDNLKNISKNIKEIQPTILVTVPLLLENIYRKILSKVGNKVLSKFKYNAALNISCALYKIKLDVRKKVFKSVHESLGGKIRLIITGAAAIDPQVSKTFYNMGVKVLQGYGLTECSPLVAGNRDNNFRFSSCGLPIPGVSVKIANPDKEGIGEITVKGDNVMLGYYQNEEATSKNIRDGWFYTGDLGKFDSDGFLYITGRLKNVIVTKNGKNIFPEEVETYINRSPLIKESLVWGKYNGEKGETYVCAQILPDLEAVYDKFHTKEVSQDLLYNVIDDIVKDVNKQMPLYKRISNFTIREKDFSKTTTQKIKRHEELKDK